MLTIENVETCGWEPALRGMRNPKDSWDRADSEWEFVEDPSIINPNDEVKFVMGHNDLHLAVSLAKGGPVHAKFRRMIVVYCDITAPLYWWKEFDTYKVGTVANSCSTMHRIHAAPLTRNNFAHERLNAFNLNILDTIIHNLNYARQQFIDSGKTDKEAWWQMIQMLPSSYLQRRTVMMNYEVLSNIYHSPRYNHKLDEWRVFCDWIKTLPYAEYLIVDPTYLEYEEAHKQFNH